MTDASAASDDLRRLREIFDSLIAVCRAVAGGDLEVRALDIEKFGADGEVLNALNEMLDQTDSFVREATASLQFAARGAFHRPFLVRGMRGAFRRSAEVIDAARLSMVEAAREAERVRAAEERARLEAQARGQRERLADEFETRVSGLVRDVEASAAAMRGVAAGMVGMADEACEHSARAALSVDRTNASAAEMVAASGRLSTSIGEIDRQIAESTAATARAVVQVEGANEAVAALGQSTQKIDKVVEFIRRIAAQTNLLALNATIEAARAGEAGRGFGVVAAEVKTLARQTADATSDITAQIQALQSAATSTAAAVSVIRQSTDQVSAISAAIAGAMHGQRSVTSAINGGVAAAARDVDTVAVEVREISAVSVRTGDSAKSVLAQADELARQADALARTMSGLLVRVRSG